MPRYLITDGDGAHTVDLQDPVVTFGRSRRCTVRLHDGSLSRIHCEIRQIGSEWWVKDLESRNQTCVNGNPITECRLAPGDRVDLGRTRIVFEPSAAGVEVPVVPAVVLPGDPAFDEANEAQETPLPVPRARARNWRWLGWALAVLILAGAGLLIVALYRAPDNTVFSFGALKFRRGTTAQLNRKVLICLGGVAGLHLLFFGARWLYGGRRERRRLKALKPSREGQGKDGGV